jgi:hypothetical protein
VSPSPPGTEPTTATGYMADALHGRCRHCWTRRTLCPDGHTNQISRSSSPQTGGNSGYLGVTSFISMNNLRHGLTWHGLRLTECCMYINRQHLVTIIFVQRNTRVLGVGVTVI